MENSTETKKLPKLTRKQRAFVNELKKNPKQSATKVALKVYNVSNENSASVLASENLRKPAIISHLNQYNEQIEQVLKDNAIEWAYDDDVNKRRLAVDTSKFIHDKLHGKAIARNLNVNTTVDIESIIDNLI